MFAKKVKIFSSKIVALSSRAAQRVAHRVFKVLKNFNFNILVEFLKYQQ